MRRLVVVASPALLHSSNVRSGSTSSDQYQCEEAVEEVIASDGAYQEVLAIDYRHPPFRSHRAAPAVSPIAIAASHTPGPAPIPQATSTSSSNASSQQLPLPLPSSRSAPSSPSLREELFCGLFADLWETLVALSRPAHQCALAASATQVLRIEHEPPPSSSHMPPGAEAVDVVRFEDSSLLSAGVGSMAVSLYNSNETDGAPVSRSPSPSHTGRTHRSRSPRRPPPPPPAPSSSNVASVNASPAVDSAGRGGGSNSPDALLGDPLASPRAPAHSSAQQLPQGAHAGLGGRVGSGLVAVPENYTLPLGFSSLLPPAASHSRAPGTALDHLTVSGNRLALQHR